MTFEHKMILVHVNVSLVMSKNLNWYQAWQRSIIETNYNYFILYKISFRKIHFGVIKERRHI